MHAGKRRRRESYHIFVELRGFPAESCMSVQVAYRNGLCQGGMAHYGLMQSDFELSRQSGIFFTLRLKSSHTYFIQDGERAVFRPYTCTEKD